MNRRMSVESGSIMNSKSSSSVNDKFEEVFLRKRTDRRINRRLQNKIDLSKKPTLIGILGSTENVKESAGVTMTTTTTNSSMIPKSPQNVTVFSDKN